MLSHEDGIEIESESEEMAEGSSAWDMTASGCKVQDELVSAVGPINGPSVFMLVAIVEPVIARLALLEDAREKQGAAPNPV